jgi:AraC-like DNA-binding protein
VVLEDPSGELVIRDGLAEIVLTDKGKARSAFAYRTYWILLHGITCWLVGRRIPIRRVDFRCAEPPEGADYRLFFGAPVQFSQPVSRLAFDRAVLKLPIVRTEQALKQFLRGAPPIFSCGTAMTPVSRLPCASGCASRRRRPGPRFSDLAAQMHMSASTLRHRLQGEGQSYAGIKDEIRRDRAIEMLLGSDAGVGEIAVQLGYSEPSAFHRAFRKWTTKSPAAFRRETITPSGE